MNKHHHQPEEEEAVNNAFETLLRQHRRGQAANEAGAELQAAIRAVEDTGKSAVIIVAVKLEPKGDDMVQTTIAVKSKLPKAEIAPAMFWIEDGNLRTQDPKQPELPLRELKKQSPVREVGQAAGE